MQKKKPRSMREFQSAVEKQIAAAAARGEFDDLPGLGIDVDERLAAEYPCDHSVEQWTQTRLPDGSPARP